MTEPTKGFICYAAGYKYQLRQDAVAESGLTLEAQVSHEYFTISESGLITVKRGYAWDGASSVAIDDPGTIYASLFHDAGYQAIRCGLIDGKWRKEFDQMYERLCIEGGVKPVRAKAHYVALRIGGGYYNRLVSSDYPTLVAP